jgi:hypothetical protein
MLAGAMARQCEPRHTSSPATSKQQNNKREREKQPKD